MTLRTLTLAATIALLVASQARAQSVASFVVADDDGYGIESCLETDAACGQPVATAWCVANGYARSIDYRKQTQADITGDLTAPTQIAAVAQPSAIIVTCER
jgi:hypothetical protein